MRNEGVESTLGEIVSGHIINVRDPSWRRKRPREPLRIRTTMGSRVRHLRGSAAAGAGHEGTLQRYSQRFQNTGKSDYEASSRGRPL